MRCRLYFHTLRHLKLSQIFWRLYYKLSPNPNINLFSFPNIRNHNGLWVNPIAKNIKILDKKKFNFLNETHELQQISDWNNPRWSKLWLYNLHYFDDLNCKSSSSRKQWHSDLIKTWINENPPGFGNGWEPYPISLRIVNWIKWCLAGNVLEEYAKNSLVIQTRYLIKRLEYHLRGNHLFANAKALIYAGLFFTGNEANAWLAKGMQILEEQLLEQVLPDGGNFELSPMYHAIFLEDLLDIINIYKHYNIEISKQIINTSKTMLSWLNSMTHPNGELSFFNDSANGISATTDELTKYYQDLELDMPGSNKNVYLKDSGYFCIKNGQMTAILDLAAVGPDYIPGHAHADSLSFECSLFKKKIIVNSGTSLYGTSIERFRQRGTKAHSTLIIDNKNSSEVWGGFRVARRARVFNTNVEKIGEEIIVSASQDGYSRLKGKPIHIREWHCTNKYLAVLDSVNGVGIHKIEVIYHLAPEVDILNNDNNYVTLSINNHKFNMKFEGKGELSIETSTYHPEFGLNIENKKIVWLRETNKEPFWCKMTLSW